METNLIFEALPSLTGLAVIAAWNGLRATSLSQGHVTGVCFEAMRAF